MADIALFPSVLGVRPGIQDAAEHLRAGGNTVLVVDLYDGPVFDDYEEAGRFTERLGYPELLRRALTAVEPLGDGFVAAGFSNGAAAAEFVVTQRRSGGVLLFSGGLPLALLGAPAWPSGIPAQFHRALDDPFGRPDWTDALAAEIRAAGGAVEVFDYPGHGHLFTDASLPGEYDPHAATLLWDRARAFCRAIDSGAHTSAATGGSGRRVPQA